ncbi:ATP-grasp domain-containing protein [Streptomyces sp. NPDC006482]|uniref:preATP grasp domain-containing protein n=1 Tax=unclassified Streptomyces TaxID=2593676 RepID=UPI002254064F|nr:ATP-grasp domain-containing protein [Streptomyces sp. NBC_00094]MCX5391922.1 ATP-grasp domain-containing protein [Streptomyces sp. NBC_00094]
MNNFEVERSWAVGEPKLPGAGISFTGTTVNRMEEMGVLLAEQGDVVVLKAPLDPDYQAYLTGLGAIAGTVLVADESDPARTVSEDALHSPELLDSLRALADGRTHLMPMGISPAEEMLSKETGLPLAGPSAQIAKHVNGKIFSRELIDATGLRAVPGAVVRTVGELSAAVREQLAGGGRVVVKESLGVSGRGMVVLEDERGASRLLRLIERRGAEAGANLVVESWVERAQDLNYQFLVGRTGEVRFETVKAAVLRNGVHQGHSFPVPLSAEVTAELHEAAQVIGAALHAEGYVGVVGVDAMLAPGDVLYPCLEINARFNMSTYQSRIAERSVPADGHAVAATIHLRPTRRHTFAEVAEALGDLLHQETGRPGVLINNFATLNAAAPADGGEFQGRLYAVCIAGDAEEALALRGEAENRLQRMTGQA